MPVSDVDVVTVRIVVRVLVERDLVPCPCKQSQVSSCPCHSLLRSNIEDALF